VRACRGRRAVGSTAEAMQFVVEFHLYISFFQLSVVGVHCYCIAIALLLHSDAARDWVGQRRSESASNQEL